MYALDRHRPIVVVAVRRSGVNAPVIPRSGRGLCDTGVPGAHRPCACWGGGPGWGDEEEESAVCFLEFMWGRHSLSS